MNNFIAQLNRLMFKQNEPDSPGLHVLKARKSILAALIESRKRGTAVGIYSEALGDGMFVSGVDDIYRHNNEPIIVFNRYDISGAILQRNILSIGEIAGICKFDVRFRNPVLT